MARPRARPVDRDHLPPQPLYLPVDNEEGDQERGDDSSPGPHPEHSRPGDANASPKIRKSSKRLKGGRAYDPLWLYGSQRS